MPRKSNVPPLAIESFRGNLELTAIKLIHIDVKDFRTIERYLNRLPSNFDFLVIPLANWTQESVLRSNAMVK